MSFLNHICFSISLKDWQGLVNSRISLASLCCLVGVFSFVAIMQEPAFAQTNNDFNVIQGKDISSDPTAKMILEKIELSKKILEELQNGQVIPLTEQQRFVEEQRKIAQAALDADLKRINKEYEDHTPRNAFAKYVSDKPDYMQAFYWDQFNYLDNKVALAKQQRDLILQNGGTIEQAQEIFYQYAHFPKSEVKTVFDNLVDKHNLYGHYAGELDPDAWYPEEAVQLFDSWKKNAGDRYLNKTEAQLSNETLLEDGQSAVQRVSLESAFVYSDSEEEPTIDALAETLHPEIDIANPIELNGQSFDQMDGTVLNGAGEFTAAAWINPDYDKGSPSFTILEKPGVFQLTINNYVEPRHVVQFSIFDGIKWHTIKSFSTIEEEWTHVAGVLEDSSISLYIDGKLEAMYHLGGTISLNSKGMIEKIPMQIKTSPEPINIGVQKIIKLDEIKTSNYFSGIIDDVVVDNEALPILEIYEGKSF